MMKFGGPLGNGLIDCSPLGSDCSPLFPQRNEMQEPMDHDTSISTGENLSCPRPIPSNPMDEVELSKAQVSSFRFSFGFVLVVGVGGLG